MLGVRRRFLSGLVALAVTIGQPAAVVNAAPPSTTASVIDATPSTRPFKATTSFSTALQCMDRLLASYDKRNIRVMADEFNDATGTLKVGARDMFVDALAAMSATSNAFIFVDLDMAPNVKLAHELTGGTRVTRPNFYIKGSFVKSDQGISSWGRRIGAAIKQASLGTSSDRMVSVIGLDMAVGDTATLELFNDARVSNEIAIVRTGKSTNAQLLLPFASIGFDKQVDTSEGTHEAVRTLIDVGTIEMIGKFTRTPYWKCLELPETDPSVTRAARSFFDRMKPGEQTSAVQAALARSGDYSGPVNGIWSPQLGQAVSRYRVANNLVGGTTVDFYLYFSLINAGFSAQPQLTAAKGAKGRADALALAIAAPPPRIDPVGTGLQLTVEPSANTLIKGDTFRLTLTVNKDAYVYCFATSENEAQSNVPYGVRVFPNQFSPSAFLKAGEPYTFPEDESQLRMRARDAGTEKIACFARRQPFAAPLPAPIAAPDLKPIQASLSEIIYALQAYDKKALDSTARFATLTVIDGAR